MRDSRGANHILNSFAHFMQSPRWLIVVALFLAWGSTSHSSIAADAPTVSPEFEQYDRLDAAARYRWLEDLLRNRMEPAARLYLASEPLADEEKYIGSILSRAITGRKLTAAGLTSIVAKVEEHERGAVEHLARDYRIAVYQAFRTQRDEFERRMAAWRVVYQAWQSAGERGDEQRLLMQWLQGATARMRAGQLAKLPAIPKFGQPQQPAIAARPPATDAPPATIPREPAKTPGAEPALAHVVRKPAIVEHKPSRTPAAPRAPLQVTPQPTPEATPSTTQAAPQVAIRTAPPRDPANSVPGVSPHHVMVPRAVEEPPVAPPLPTAPDPSVITQTPAATSPASPPRPTRPPVATNLPSTNPLPAARPNVPAPQVTAPAVPRSDAPAPVAAQPPQVARKPVEVAQAPVIPAPAVPAAAPQGNAAANEGVLRNDSGTVRIDLSELAARVAGYNLALGSLAERLDDGKLWETDQLNPALDELSDLNRRGSDLKLYWYLVPPKERIGLGEIDSPDAVLALLGSKIFASRNKLLNNVYEGTVEEKQARLTELDKLSQRLARLGVTAARRIEPEEAQR